MSKIEFNGKSYDEADLSDDAKKYLMGIKIANASIRRLQGQMMLARTAKGTYTKLLQDILNKQ